MGLPVGTDTFTRNKCIAIAEKAAGRYASHAQTAHSKEQFLLNTSTAGMSTIMHALRALPPRLTKEAATILDQATVDAVAHCIGYSAGEDLDTYSRVLASFPTRYGGAAFRYALDHTEAAHLGALSM